MVGLTARMALSNSGVSLTPVFSYGFSSFRLCKYQKSPFFSVYPMLGQTPCVWYRESDPNSAIFFRYQRFFFVNPMDKIIGDVNGENYILTNTYRVFFQFVQTKRFYHQCFVLEINMNSNSQFGYYHSSTWFCKVLNMEAPQIRRSNWNSYF